MFDRVVVAVYDVATGGSLFPLKERVKLFQGAVSHLDRVEVKPFSGLVVDFARKEQAKVLVRGSRAVSDFEAEVDMALMNKKMAPEIESIYFIASLEHLYVSGHRIREVAGLGYDVGELVPANVLKALKSKFGGTR